MLPILVVIYWSRNDSVEPIGTGEGRNEDIVVVPDIFTLTPPNVVNSSVKCSTDELEVFILKDEKLLDEGMPKAEGKSLGGAAHLPA